jgi:hypothetical protein
MAVTAPCYLIICSPTLAIVIEKDLQGPAQILKRTSKEFIVHTNHDVAQPENQDAGQMQQQKELGAILGLETLLEESVERMNCVERKWAALKRRKRRTNRAEQQDLELAIKEETLKGWVKAYPVMNECTHFGCIMDPRTGTIRWLTRGTL